jgi:hypothetical protein
VAIRVGGQTKSMRGLAAPGRPSDAPRAKAGALQRCLSGRGSGWSAGPPDPALDETDWSSGPLQWGSRL